MNRDFYLSLTSKTEAEEILSYFESKGEKVSRDYLYCQYTWEWISYCEYKKVWQICNSEPKNKLKKTFEELKKMFEKEFKFKIGDVVKPKPGGYFYAYYNVSLLNGPISSPSRDLKFSNIKISERNYSEENGMNWYREVSGNWISEEGLELEKYKWYHHPGWVNENDYVKCLESEKYNFSHTDGCIKNGKFSNRSAIWWSSEEIKEVSLKEISKYLPEGHPDKLFNTEYYEFIGESVGSFTKGRVYKIIDPYNLEAIHNFIDDRGESNGFGGSNYQKFKPSTKEAFDSQQELKYPLTEKQTIPLEKSLMDLAKEKYKIGDIVISPHNGEKFEITESKGDMFYNGTHDNILAYKSLEPGVREYVYYQGKWAEILLNKPIASYEQLSNTSFEVTQNTLPFLNGMDNTVEKVHAIEGTIKQKQKRYKF